MSDNWRADGFLDSKRYNENRNRLPPELLEPYAGQYVAFNAEGTCVLAHGEDHFAVEAMLRAKGVDLLVVNDVSQQGIGFDAEDNQVLLLDRWGGTLELPRMSKLEVAHAILDRVLALRSTPKTRRAQPSH